jgi:hypothetical protein
MDNNKHLNGTKHLDMLKNNKIYSKEYLEKELTYYQGMLKDCQCENDKVIIYQEKIDFIKQQLDKINSDNIKSELVDEQYKSENNIEEMFINYRHWKEKNDPKYHRIDNVYMNDETGDYKFIYSDMDTIELAYIFNCSLIHILTIKNKKIYPSNNIEMYLESNRNNYLNVLFEHHLNIVNRSNRYNLIEIDLTKGNDVNITIIAGE